ncbi:MAG: hydrogen peroxide-inducible genes activator [Chitinophagaceae bacterium]
MKRFINRNNIFYTFIDFVYNMTLQQLEYAVAVDTYRHFARAAEGCFVTQATLSMMIKKLETEIGTVLFDRSKQPVVPTEAGSAILEQARIVLKEASVLTQMSKDLQLSMQGEMRIGVIPTLAPYLLPLILPSFLKKYPSIRLKIVEQTTEHLLQLLQSDKLDVAIMATPVPGRGFREAHLFYEEFKVFVSSNEQALKKKYILAEEININKLWLLEEGHCLRSQTLNLCELQKQQAKVHNLDYETGSIESLLRITEMNEGITIIPELATINFDKKGLDKIRHFKPPVPVREISLVTYRHFVKRKLLDLLQEVIVAGVSPYLAKAAFQNRVIPV